MFELFYEGSELRIELESAFTALIKLALNDKWAHDWSIFELLKSQKFDFLRSQNTLILFEKLETYLIA